MAINPDTNMIELLHEAVGNAVTQESLFPETTLVRPNGDPVPPHWAVVAVGEKIVVKNYTFTVAHIGEKHILLEPCGTVIVGEIE